MTALAALPAWAGATVVSFDFEGKVVSGSYDARVGTIVSGTLTYDTATAVMIRQSANEAYYMPSGASITFSYVGASSNAVNYSGQTFHANVTPDVMSRNGILTSSTGQPVFFTNGTAFQFRGTVDTPGAPFGQIDLSLGMSPAFLTDPILPETLPELADFGTPSVARFSFAATNAAHGQAIAQLTSFGPSPVPEAATWGMMILGFGIVGASLRGGKRAPAVRAAASPSAVAS